MNSVPTSQHLPSPALLFVASSKFWYSVVGDGCTSSVALFGLGGGTGVIGRAESRDVVWSVVDVFCGAIINIEKNNNIFCLISKA